MQSMYRFGNVFLTCIHGSYRNGMIQGSATLKGVNNSSVRWIKHSASNSNLKVLKEKENEEKLAPPEYRFIYPEFLPEANLYRRHNLRERLERMDMLKRRSIIEIPEFYVGSILSVTVADKHAEGRMSQFVGICIQRQNPGTRAYFVLRNVVDGMGIEIGYDLYNPTIQSIEVLRLERRLDDNLLYLRDAPLKYSTFPFDMEAEPIQEGGKVPVNTMKVKLNPWPWSQRWENKHELRGLEDPLPMCPKKRAARAKNTCKPWEKHDLMLEYRNSIPEEDQREIFREVHEHAQTSAAVTKRSLRRKAFVKPKKTV